MAPPQKKSSGRKKKGARKKAGSQKFTSVVEPALRTIFRPASSNHEILKELERERSRNGHRWMTCAIPDLYGYASGPTVHQADFADVLQYGATTDLSSIPYHGPINRSDGFIVPDLASGMPLLGWPDTMLYFGDAYGTHDGLVNFGCQRSLLRDILRRAYERWGVSVNLGIEPEAFMVFEGQSLAELNLGPSKGYYQRGANVDPTYEVKQALIGQLIDAGLPIKLQHCEVTPGQFEINFDFSSPVVTCDRIVWLLMVLPKLAKARGCNLTWHPKPTEIHDPLHNGSGFHMHYSVWSEARGNMLFNDDGTMTKFGASFIAGVQQHIPAITWLGNLDPQAYRRLSDPGCEAPTNGEVGWQNRSLAIRLTGRSKGALNTRHFEVRSPSSTMNPYLTSLSVVAAGFDGVERNLPAPTLETENAYTKKDPRYPLPTSFEEGQRVFARDELMARAFPGELFRALCVMPSQTRFGQYGY